MAETPRLLHGPGGADSPLLDAYDDNLTADRWYAWLRIGADRDAGRPSDRNLLADALDVDEPTWSLYWYRAATGGRVCHRAEIIGATLVSACGYSEPAGGLATTRPAQGPSARDPKGLLCIECARLTPAPPAPAE